MNINYNIVKTYAYHNIIHIIKNKIKYCITFKTYQYHVYICTCHDIFLCQCSRVNPSHTFFIQTSCTDEKTSIVDTNSV